MVKIRLTRIGRKNEPFYRVVVADQRRARDGRFIEILGQYQPVKVETHVKIDKERALYWLHQGAQPSDTVRSIFRKLGIMKEYHEAKVAAKKALKSA
jgi:small subunit ribosomal protein S16